MNGTVGLGHADQVAADAVVTQRVVMHADAFPRFERSSSPALPGQQSRARRFEIPLDDLTAVVRGVDSEVGMRVGPAPLLNLSFYRSNRRAVEHDTRMVRERDTCACGSEDQDDCN